MSVRRSTSERNFYGLRRAAQLDAPPSRGSMRDRIRTAKGLINPNRVKMGSLPTGHFDVREEESKSLSTCIDRQQQCNRDKLSKPRVVGLDCIRLKALVKRTTCVGQGRKRWVTPDCVFHNDV